MKVDTLGITEKLTGRKGVLAEQALAQINDLKHEYNVHVIEAKRAIDELSHEKLSHSSDPVVRRIYGKLKVIRDDYGEESLFYNTILKMIVPYERPRRAIIEEVKKAGVLPAAFQKELIAVNQMDDWPVVSFCDDAIDGSELSDEYQTKHRNCYRLLKLLQKRFNRYMDKLQWKYYLLLNGSNTRFEDGVNLQDVNGQCYATAEEIRKVNEDWRELIQYFKISNFDDRNFFYEIGAPLGTYGSINYAPDDSGKTRISYCIDPIVQIISKAVHKCMEYLVKRIACNGTYDQMSVIRNMIKKGVNVNQLIISTDMSKYSDTLQINRILELLKKIGIPENIIEAIRDLYTLPMYDTVLRRVTPRTTASYQGQYGDFPFITLKNIWNQLCVYDYLNWTYNTNFIIVLEMKHTQRGQWINTNYTNSAVGDDTIMVFLNCDLDADLVFEVIRAVFNRDGVNINRTKTHILDRGSGKCDFIKRIITPNGLVPYLRWKGITGTEDDLCEELLRYYRDNILSDEQFHDICQLSMYSRELYRLHPINGGVIDRPVEELDLYRLVRRAESLNERYTPRNRDEIRKWIDRVHQRGDNLLDTCLVGLLQYSHIIPGYGEEDGDEDFDICSCSIVEEIKAPIASEENVVSALLNLNWMGYEHYTLKELRSLLGMTWSDICKKRPDVALFLKDHEEKEIYRQMTISKKILKNTTYSDMFSITYLPYVLPDYVERQMRCEISSFEDRNLGTAEYIISLIVRRSSRVFYKTVYGIDYMYYEGTNEVFRLYHAEKTKYRFIPFFEFVEALGIRYSKSEEERLRRVYDNVSFFYE